MPYRRKKALSYEGDPLIPLMNLVCLLIPMLLFGAIFVRFVTIEVNAPKITLTAEPTEEQLDLRVVVTERGFHFKVNPRYRLSWMSAATHTSSAIPDIPKRDHDWDYKSLRSRLLELKEQHRHETRILLSAEEHISYEVMIKAMDYSRGTESDPLFPDVTLARTTV